MPKRSREVVEEGRAGRSKGGIVCKFRSIPGATDEEQREGNNELGCTDEDNKRIDSPVCGSMLSGRHPVVDANKGTREPKLLQVGRPRERRVRGKGCSCRHEIACVVATRRTMLAPSAANKGTCHRC